MGDILLEGFEADGAGLGGEVVELRPLVVATRLHPIEVFHAHQPAAADSSGIQIGGKGCNQRAEMQVAAGGGGEASDV